MSQDLQIHEQILRMKSCGQLSAGRSTLSLRSAALVKPYFDELLRTGKPVVLKVEIFGVSKATLYRKILDGIRWLYQRDPVGKPGALCNTHVEQQRYSVLKSRWYIEELEDGYRIHPNKIEIQQASLQAQLAHHQKYIEQQINAQAANSGMGSNWREDFDKFIETAPSGQEFVRRGIALMPEDREYLQNTADQLGAGIDISEDGTAVVFVKP